MKTMQDIVQRWRPRLKLMNAYQRCFDTPEGKIVLRDLMREGGLLATSVVVGAPDETQFNEGRRALALYILDKLRFSQEELLLLARERAQDQVADAMEAA